MGGGGQEIDYTELLPQELQDLRKKLAAFASAQMGEQGTTGLRTATPYLGPMSSGLDPMSLMASNIMMAYGNQLPYNLPNMFYGSEMTPYGSMPEGTTTTTGRGGGKGKGGPGTFWDEDVNKRKRGRERRTRENPA